MEQTTRDATLSRPILSFENLQIYEDRFCVNGTFYLFSNVRSIRGGAIKDTINFVPFTQSSSLHIRLNDDQVFSFGEESRFLKGERHKAIQAAHALMRKATFQQRLENLAARVRRQRAVELVKEMPPYLDQVLLHCNGFVESNGTKIDLKAAKKVGTLWLGTESHSVGYNKQSISPNQVVVSQYKPGLLGPHKESIRFIPVEEEADITLSLINWLGDDPNTLC